MSAQTKVSAGLLLYRRGGGRLEVLLAHPGGPFWARKDNGAWTCPKGLVDAGEDMLAAARREFAEETGYSPAEPFLSLGSVRLKSGKVIHVWACEDDLDPAKSISNSITIEWPPGTGRTLEIPEVDRVAWFDPDTARIKLNAAQVEFVDRLEQQLTLEKHNVAQPRSQADSLDP